jgi:hypothetical protein
MIVWPAKDPAEVLDFTWTVPLDGDDVIDSFSPTLISGSITIDSNDKTDLVGTLWISGGTADEIAQISLRAVTEGGRTFRELGVLPLVDRASEVLADFRLRYPAFAAVADGPIGFWLAKAGAEVGANWPSEVIAEAKCAWSAHRLALAGALSAMAMPDGVTSFKSGDFSATFADSVAARTGYDATVYGREFKALQRRNFGGPVLMGSGCA